MNTVQCLFFCIQDWNSEVWQTDYTTYRHINKHYWISASEPPHQSARTSSERGEIQALGKVIFCPLKRKEIFASDSKDTSTTKSLQSLGAITFELSTVFTFCASFLIKVTSNQQIICARFKSESWVLRKWLSDVRCENEAIWCSYRLLHFHGSNCPI